MECHGLWNTYLSERENTESDIYCLSTRFDELLSMTVDRVDVSSMTHAHDKRGSREMTAEHMTLLQDPNIVFIILRNKNTNAVAYRSLMDGEKFGKKPIEAYWMSFHEYPGDTRPFEKKRDELSFLDRTAAYGVCAKPVVEGKEYDLKLTAIPSRRVRLKMDLQGKPRAMIHMNGKEYFLYMIYAHDKPNFIGLPTVEYVNLHGIDPMSGEEHIETIKP